MSLATAPDFRGTRRFDVIRRIGAGGMGVVYEAWDNDRNARVALKTLTGLDPHSVHLFKNEFRALTDISHPNLAVLYELFAEESQWLFSMEYVEGGHFLDFVRPGWDAITTGDSDLRIGPDEPTLVTNSVLSPGDAGTHVLRPLPGFCDLDKIAAAVGQLARALLALHAGGILHRDLKPLNVKVTPQGRVVVLDFGLAAHAGPGFLGEASTRSNLVGTVSYMSPEQAGRASVTAATDWYGLGVMIYEALTGSLPFDGGAASVIQEKRRLDAPRVSLAIDVPEEWDALCAGLLERNPQNRMGGREVLALLERRAVPSRRSPARSAERVFVGREKQLALLREGFAACEAGVPSLVFVHGKSGIGKSSLIERFLGELAEIPRVVVLAGRCYERESMPYKAFDGVIDSLARYLAGLPGHEAAELIPRDAATLAQVFPVLRQVEAIASAPQRLAQVDQHELRRKAFGALRECFARLGDRHRVVLYIDDLQWGDTDSAALLSEILRAPGAPAFLFLGSYRSEYRQHSAALDAFLTGLPTGIPAGKGAEVREIAVGPLSADESWALAARLLTDQTRPAGWIEEIARESEGSPYLLQEIAASFENTGQQTAADGPITIDSVLHSRIATLPEEPRRFLETVALSVKPLSEREIFAAAEIPVQDPKLPVMLRTSRLIRSTGGGGAIEPWHDRVRETIVAHMSPEALVRCHRRLAEALERAVGAGGRVDSEAAAIHFEGAADYRKASMYYAAAADAASAALAFTHAAELCQRALDLSPATGEARRHLLVRLAEALGNAGRGPQAARAYREAGRGAGEPEVFELERKEAYFFASSGHLDEGREVLLKILRRMKMSVPGALGQIAGFLLFEVWLMLRGLNFRKREEHEINSAELARIDIYWDVSRSFSMIDPPAALYLTASGLLMALRAGESGRVARALALQSVGSSALQKPFGRGQASRFLQTCGELSARESNPYLNGVFRLGSGMTAMLAGQWLESLGQFRQAARIFSEECAGASWELATAHIYSLWDLLYSGQYRELCRLAPILSQEGEARGDLFQAVTIEAGPRPFCELIADRPQVAHATLDAALSRWTPKYKLQFAIAVFIRGWILLYQGRARDAWEFFEREWPGLAANHFLRISGTRQWLHFGRAQSTLTLAAQSPKAGKLLGAADRDARHLEADQAGFAHSLATLVRAGCASRRGHGAQALLLLEKAAAELDGWDMPMFAAAARRRLGELQGGDGGMRLVAEADRAMRAEGVVDPVRFTSLFANGFTPQLPL